MELFAMDFMVRIRAERPTFHHPTKKYFTYVIDKSFRFPAYEEIMQPAWVGCGVRDALHKYVAAVRESIRR